jgi:hypothetical protein
MIAITGSGGIADKYGGTFLDDRKRIKIHKTSSPKKAVNEIIKHKLN